MSAPASSVRKGVACILVSAFGFSLMAVFVRLADSCGGETLPAIQKAFFRNFVAAGIAAWVFLKRNPVSSIPSIMPKRKRDWVDLLLRCAVGTGGVFANFYAIPLIPIGDSIALNKTAPFFTLLLSWLLLGERMSIRQILCVAGAFCGAMLVVKPGAEGIASPVPAFVGLLSGFLAGTAYAYLHKLGRAGVDSAFIILFFSVFSCVACLPFIALDYVPMTHLQIGMLLCAGASATLGQFGITWAYRFAEPRQIAVFDYFGIIFASLLGFAVFGQVPDILSFLGFAAIIAMGALLHRPSGEVKSRLRRGEESACGEGDESPCRRSDEVAVV